MTICDYDPNEVSDKPANARVNFEKFVRLEYNQEIIMKLMVNPLYKDAQGKGLRYYTYKSFWYDFVNKKGVIERRSRPSLSVIGQEDPQEVLAKELSESLKVLKANKQDNTLEYMQKEKDYKKFRPTIKAVFLFVRPDSAKIEALEVPTTVADELFGKESYGDKPAKEGLFTKMLEKDKKKKDDKNSNNPYDLRSNRGWLSIKKIGTTWNDTKYPITEAKVTTIDENGDEVNKPVRLSVSPDLFSLDIDSCPDVKKIASQFMWSVDEVRSYVESNGANVPNRLINDTKDNATENKVEEQSAPLKTDKKIKHTTPTVTDEDLDDIFED